MSRKNRSGGFWDMLIGKIDFLFAATRFSIVVSVVGVAAPALFFLFGDAIDGLREQIKFLLVPIVINVLYVPFSIWREWQVGKESRYRFATSAITIAALKINVTQRTSTIKDAALSLTYLSHLRRGNENVKFALFSGSMAFVAIGLLGPFDVLGLSALMIFLLGLIYAKEALVEFRIRRGYFGNNRKEAFEILRFLIEHSDDIDFTDGSGRLRQALIPEDERKESCSDTKVLGGAAV